jgi:hypothetical protein
MKLKVSAVILLLGICSGSYAFSGQQMNGMESRAQVNENQHMMQAPADQTAAITTTQVDGASFPKHADTTNNQSGYGDGSNSKHSITPSSADATQGSEKTYSHQNEQVTRSNTTEQMQSGGTTGQFHQSPQMTQQAAERIEIDTGSRQATLKKRMVHFAADSAIALYSYNYDNYQSHFSKLQHQFTKHGWNNYYQALTQSGNVEEVVKRTMQVSATKRGPVQFERAHADTSDYRGQTFWQVNVPITASFSSKEFVEQQSLTVQLQVRVQKDVYGHQHTLIDFVTVKLDRPMQYHSKKGKVPAYCLKNKA